MKIQILFFVPSDLENSRWVIYRSRGTRVETQAFCWIIFSSRNQIIRVEPRLKKDNYHLWILLKPEACIFIKKETLAQVSQFSCKFYEISKKFPFLRRDRGKKGEGKIVFIKQVFVVNRLKQLETKITESMFLVASCFSA